MSLQNTVFVIAFIMTSFVGSCKSEEKEENQPNEEKNTTAYRQQVANNAERLSFPPKTVSLGGEYEERAAANISAWKTDKTTDYTGEYHYGNSEWEWSMVVTQCGDTYTFQKFGPAEIVDNHFEGVYKTFNNTKIEGNQIIADSLKGFFAFYKNDKGVMQKGLILFKPLYEVSDSADFGYLNDYPHYYPGDFPELSQQVLSEEYFANNSKFKLKLMRNEILARYDYKFEKDGDVYDHFIKKDWYKPLNNDVYHYLTTIEKINTATLSRLENK